MLNVYFYILVPNKIVFIQKGKQVDHLREWRCGHSSSQDNGKLINTLVHKLQETRFIARTTWLGHSEE